MVCGLFSRERERGEELGTRFFMGKGQDLAAKLRRVDDMKKAQTQEQGTDQQTRDNKLAAELAMNGFNAAALEAQNLDTFKKTNCNITRDFIKAGKADES